MLPNHYMNGVYKIPQGTSNARPGFNINYEENTMENIYIPAIEMSPNFNPIEIPRNTSIPINPILKKNSLDLSSDQTPNTNNAPVIPKMYRVTEKLNYASEIFSTDMRKENDTNASKGQKNLCRFCERNGEVSDVFLSHQLRDSRGNVTCPYLKKYVCPLCKKTGSDAHTITYCPLSKACNGNKRIKESPAIALKNSLYNSNGQLRK